jgi:hypothetical protein
MMTDAQIDAAAKVLAECMDYPWEHMPKQGRDNMRKHARAVLAAAQPAPVPCVRHELVTAIHSLASDFENSLYAFRDDTEARRKAEGDIAHAMKIAAKHNQNGPACPAAPVPVPVAGKPCEYNGGTCARRSCLAGRQCHAMALAAHPAPAVLSWAPLKMAMQHSAWEGTLQLGDALANIDDFAKAAQPAPVPLTNERLRDIVSEYGTGGWQTINDMVRFARAIERAHGIAASPEVPRG